MDVHPPPRPVPTPLRIRVLFGGFMGQFGWLFCAAGMLFVWIFDPGGGIEEAIVFRGAVETAEGRTVGYEATNLSINERRVFETRYTFEHAEAGTLEGSSYATGDWLEAGVPVTIEYLASDPTRSRIAGMRGNAGGLGSLFIFIFPGVGLLFGVGSLASRLRPLRLLRDGRVTRGTLVSSEATNTRVNNRPVMKLTFEFEAESGGVFHATAKTHQPRRLEDEERELLVYDPRNPSSAALLDEVPCQPRFDERGNLEASVPGLPTALYVLLPGISALTILRYVASLL